LMTTHIVLNGQILVASSIPGSSESATETFFFGGNSRGDQHFEGRLDEIAIFDRALSVKEIKKLAIP
ncbi:MAG: LamG-like jellyroll fold domain-containing protein, partial [Verrucomicrobiota bacterium]